MFGLFKTKLPNSDDLFVKYLSPWYPVDERPNMPRPDMYELHVFEGKSLDIDLLQYLDEETLTEVQEMIKSISEATLLDFQEMVESDKIDLELLDAVDKFYNRSRIADLIKNSNPKEFNNQYLVAVCEFGAFIGQIFNKMEGFDWLYAYPYFHSVIVHKETGLAITVFDWAVKKFSEYGVDDGYAEKVNAALYAIGQHPKES